MLRELDAKLFCMSFLAKQKVKEFFTKEDGAVDMIAIVVLIGIVVLLAILFRKQISNLINTLFNKINTSATDALNETD